MSATAVDVRTATGRHPVRFVRQAWLLGVKEIRTVLRMPAAWLPGLFIPMFFFFVNVAALGKFAERFGITNWKGFQLPVAILFSVSNGGAGFNLVTDIESGYFDKLLLTPASRLALLLGAMAADFTRVVTQALLLVVVALLTGTVFATGVPGALLMVAIASLWGLAFSAIGFAIALKTGSAQATQSVFVLFFPFVFLTTAFAPLEALSGWLQTAARYNPMTYLLSGMRALSMQGWGWAALGKGLLAISAVGVVTIGMALRALYGRVK